MTPFVTAWRVRLGIAVLVLLSGSSISVAHPRFSAANLRGAGLALVLQASGTASQNPSATGSSANGQVIMKVIVLAVWRWRLYRQKPVPTLAYLVFALVAVLALVYQGSLGGAMVLGHP
jgi:hypothetical protein